MATTRKIIATIMDKEFTEALSMIENGGSLLKKGYQIAARKAANEVLNRQTLTCANALQRKLDALESNHYAKLFKKNFMAYCGYFTPELSTKNVQKYYTIDGKAPIEYSKEKGNKGWRINEKIFSANIAIMKKNYSKYLDKVHFAEVKLEEKTDKKSLSEIWKSKLLDAQDIINAFRDFIDSDDAVMQEFDSETMILIKYLVKAPKIK